MNTLPIPYHFKIIIIFGYNICIDTTQQNKKNNMKILCYSCVF